MSQSAKATRPVRPDIFLSAKDHETLSRLVGDMPDPGRISRQVNPEQIRIVPAPPTQGASR